MQPDRRGLAARERLRLGLVHAHRLEMVFRDKAACGLVYDQWLEEYRSQL